MRLAGELQATGAVPAGLGWPSFDDQRSTGRAAGAHRAAGALLGAARSMSSARHALRQLPGASDTATRTRLRAFAFSRLAAEMCTHFGLRIAISGPVPEGPVVLAANHVGYVDPLLLASLVPCVPLAKREVSRWPVIGKLGCEHGVIFIERGSPRSGARGLRAAHRALAAGVSVLNFPEGTTTAGHRVLAFRRGIFGIARHARVPVVPVALRLEDHRLAWTGDASLLPHLLRTLARGAGRVRVRFGCPMTPERYESGDALAREAQAMVEHLLWAA